MNSTFEIEIIATNSQWRDDLSIAFSNVNQVNSTAATVTKTVGTTTTLVN